MCLVWDKGILTLDFLFARGCNKLPTATCFMCFSDIESIYHLFYRYFVARDIWNRLALLFNFQRAPSSNLDL